MHKSVILVILMGISSTLTAQVYDDFSDGEIASNPAWTGDTGDFIVNAAFELQLSAPAAGSSAIWTEAQYSDSLSWSIDYRMDFAPSASNRLRIFLAMDVAAPSGTGYALEIGENGSSDAVKLLKVEGGNDILLATSPGIFGDDPSAFTLIINRTLDGTWTGQAIEQSDVIQLFSVNDAGNLPASGYFGIQCTYSETRKDLFFFDNIDVSTPVPDTIPPVLEEARPIDQDEVTLHFNEAVDIGSLVAGNITVTPDIGNPAGVMPVPGEPATARILLDGNLESGVTYTVLVNAAADLAGNVAGQQSAEFTFVLVLPATPFDILINEVMADPSPPIALPNAEYLELYNNSANYLDLASVILHVGASTRTMPEFVFAPGTYLILTDADFAADLSPYAEVVSLNGFPVLTNSGTVVSLVDQNDAIVHQIDYDLTWYQDPSKDEGGWSLELINPGTPCALSSNWRASVSLTGGTPGQPNSILDTSVADTQGPRVRSLFPDPSGNAIVITYDEILGTGTPDLTLVPSAGNISIASGGQIMTLLFDTPLSEQTLYTLTLDNVVDCIGNAATSQEFTFGLPSEAAQGDLLINELLFDPAAGGARYLELYNQSDKFLSTADLSVFEQTQDQINLRPVDTDFLIDPQSYVVFTADPADVLTRYPVNNADVIIASDLPAFDREASVIGVVNQFGDILDTFVYDLNLHNVLIDDTKGVALERISFQAPTNDRSNWQSAAKAVAYGTPGLKNSQSIGPGGGEGVFEIVQTTFSPDGDGFDDVFLVRFIEPRPGTLATIRIFDAVGREIFQPLRNEVIGAGSLAQWDGATSEGIPAPVGVYICIIETFDAQGNTSQYKVPIVLAARF